MEKKKKVSSYRPTMAFHVQRLLYFYIRFRLIHIFIYLYLYLCIFFVDGGPGAHATSYDAFMPVFFFLLFFILLHCIRHGRETTVGALSLHFSLVSITKKTFNCMKRNATHGLF